ncbi:hypothetical protein [Cupriavidus pauculus]
MEIEKGTFEDIVRKMMANLDGQHQPELAGTSGTTRPACGQFTDSMAASALAAALSEHGFTINEGSPEDGQVLGDEDFKDIEEDLRREEARIVTVRRVPSFAIETESASSGVLAGRIGVRLI